MKNFQIILLVIFIFAAVIGVLVFSGTIPLGDQEGEEGSGGEVVLWGTVPFQDLAQAIENFNRQNPVYILKYEQKRADTFNEDLLEALASGEGPDIFFITDDLAYKYSNKILIIPYESYPVSVFRQNFVGAGEVFLTSEGSIAFPLAVDPLVMYYNRSMLESNNIIYPPATWQEFREISTALTQKNESGRILKSGAALGHFSNITNAKEILSMLFMQTGNPIVVEDRGTFISVLDRKVGAFEPQEVLEFYTDFADPLDQLYSWNRALPESRNAFSSENLAFYFGLASELESLVERNPNQNFMVAPVPQIEGSQRSLTSARVLGIAVSSFSENLNSSFLVAGLLSTGDFSAQFSENTGMAPARRDILAAGASPDNPYQEVFYSSALFARSWLSPDAEDTSEVFKNMVDKVLSNSLTPLLSIREASSRLNILLAR